ncbi:MAG: hypothetical protein FJ241_12105 [Nitrospira sp.]|nr:hypothetical protein [Nitrospira sp.]
MKIQRGVLLLGALILLIVISGTMARIGVNIFKGIFVLIGRGAVVIAIILLIYFLVKKMQNKMGRG